MVWYGDEGQKVDKRDLCVELLSQVDKQVLVSIRSFTVEPHNVMRTLTDPVSNQLRDSG